MQRQHTKMAQVKKYEIAFYNITDLHSWWLEPGWRQDAQ